MTTKFFYSFYLILILIFVGIHIGTACSCWPYQSAFCTNVRADDHVILAEVIDFPETYLMEVEIIQNINNAINEDTIVILGQDGINCGEWLELFNISDTLILAVDWAHINEDPSWYLEGACGLHYLRYENGMVNGQITHSLTTQPFSEFEDDMPACVDYAVTTVSALDILEKEGGVKTFPNPISDKCFITSEGIAMEQYDIYDAKGTLILSENLRQPLENIEINTNDLDKGVYYIRMKTPKGILTRRLLKI